MDQLTLADLDGAFTGIPSAGEEPGEPEAEG
jgi:hypothetical protein